jgi:hypothetical protein
MMPTFMPARIAETAARPVTIDLPTPPLPLTMPMIFLIFAPVFCGTVKSIVRDSQFAWQSLQLWLQLLLLISCAIVVSPYLSYAGRASHIVIHVSITLNILYTTNAGSMPPGDGCMT